MDIYRTDDVFGISRDVPLNYVVRESADGKLIAALTRDKHLVIHGSSKQGKTCLRKHCLDSADYIVVHCSNKWDLGDLHSAILKQCGFEVTLSSTRARSGKQKIFAKMAASIFGAKAEGGAESTSEQTTSQTKAPLELEAEDVNDIISALTNAKFDRYIVLEDFHYLPIETQKDFAVALKAFHENSSICFIIVGVWLEENRLSVYNGDLTGRVLSIDADKWTSDELTEVIDSGAKLLNVTFPKPFVQTLLKGCFDSVHIVQEACYELCVDAALTSTRPEHLKLEGTISADEYVRRVVAQQSGRFNSFITQFGDGFQDTDLQMYRWLLYPVLTSPVEKLKEGLRLREINEVLRQNHPRGATLNPGNVTQALQSVAALQIKKDIKPTVLDYDQTNLRLNVVDRSFLIWLEYQDQAELLQAAGLDL